MCARKFRCSGVDASSGAAIAHRGRSACLEISLTSIESSMNDTTGLKSAYYGCQFHIDDMMHVPVESKDGMEPLRGLNMHLL
jgi:hypothetical protein